jgi:hypothetical protein
MIGGKKAELTDPAPLLEVIKQLRESNDEAQYSLDADGSSEDSSKWYQHEEELREFSKLHPGILFTLHGEGAENEDIWNKYFYAGKCQVAKAKISIAEFDFKKLE